MSRVLLPQWQFVDKAKIVLDFHRTRLIIATDDRMYREHLLLNAVQSGIQQTSVPVYSLQV